jgi:hypothetical protein
MTMISQRHRARPDDSIFEPPVSGLRRKRSKQNAMACAALALVVAAGIAGGVYSLIPAPRSPVAGPVPCSGSSAALLFMDAGECVGVTGLSGALYDFDPGPSSDEQGIASVEKLINEQNADAVKSGDYVDVALLTPLTRSPNGEVVSSGIDEVSLARIDDELRGAYLAQYYANQKAGVEPEIRLLLANEGSQEQAWQQVTRQLAGLARTGPHPLVAITGMGISVTATQQGAQSLCGEQIPMIGAVTTGDVLDNGTCQYLARVVPDVSSQVNALVRYMPEQPAVRKAVLIWDSTAHDLYTKDLKTAFTADWGESNIGSPFKYVPSLEDPTVFSGIASAVCDTQGPPPEVLYAGRESVLQNLVTQFQIAPACQASAGIPKHILIVTASDANALPSVTTQSPAGDAQVSVVYSDIENLGLINGQFKAMYLSQLKAAAAAGLEDPWMVASYNAMTDAWTAIQDAARASVESGQTGPISPQDVWQFTETQTPMSGAAGPFAITSNGDLQLNSTDIPIVEITNGDRTTVHS